jgi:hypothetical protein
MPSRKWGEKAAREGSRLRSAILLILISNSDRRLPPSLEPAELRARLTEVAIGMAKRYVAEA